MYGTKLPFITTNREPNEPVLGDPLPRAEVQDVLNRALAGDITAYRVEPWALVQTLDPATGNSLMQMAVNSENPLEYVMAVIDGFGRVKGRYYEWAQHALYAHQNHDGDTVMHMAARHGNVVLMTLLYRWFRVDSSYVIPEETDEIHNPPELFRYYQDFEYWDSPSLALLLTKNSSGRCAAEEARMAGHEDVARWLEDIVSRLDPDGTRRLDTNMAKLVEETREQYDYAWMETRNR